MESVTKYKDKKFFLIAIAFISAFNYYLTYSNIHLNWFLVYSYLIDTFQGWLAWWAVRSIIIYLDRKMPYEKGPMKRILLQLIVTTAAGLAVIIVLTELVSWIVKGRPALLNFYTFDIFIFVIWFIAINGIYVGLHYYEQLKHSEKRRMEEKKVRLEGLTVKMGNQNLLLQNDDLLAAYVENGNTIILTRQNKKYFPDRSLDRIEEQLPGEFFFRLNRQYIVHRKAVTGFKRMGDGKIDVMLDVPEGIPHTVPVSRLKAAKFKAWFQPD
jgi:DNA-binding LytR/AlgR family response regulator